MTKKNLVTIDKDIEEIVPTFLENRKKDIITLESAINQKDCKSIEVIAHKLAGNAGSYGFDELGSIGIIMESAAKDNNIDVINNQLSLMKNYLENLEVVYE